MPNPICTNNTCDLYRKCYRAQAVPSKKNQSWNYFAKPISGACDYYIKPNKGEEK